MNCIIVDDEPLARKAIEKLVGQTDNLDIAGSFNGAEATKDFLATNTVDLVFLDIQMPGVNGIEFARTIPKNTLVVFTTAYHEFASESYEVDAIDYLIKPVKPERFQKAVDKAQTYCKLFHTEQANSNIENITTDYIFVRSERRIFKVYFSDILYIEGLKDYVIIYLATQKVITLMNIKTIHELLPKSFFVRVSKSYIINVNNIDSVDNNTVYIRENEIPIGNIYRDHFFNEFVTRKILSK
ncbi:LytTR family DNA-binding domain-containing protein [Mucilaginibacter sp. UR6-1]|uniref:LytR/AlgR family response regulator transcription factor n=1 Tax=Mucilaginibacter sp. UR6-1 TaxID=1435643 RepID=UPI001E5AA50B|nr:LytTR family DNA-binding domain-containing protein [Mucilaginibacter sp. UR6-1]MCC8409107.1 LytTR family DNA-binding domain-containing protein [Mucilaginibacter sp. UR6-1]